MSTPTETITEVDLEIPIENEQVLPGKEAVTENKESPEPNVQTSTPDDSEISQSQSEHLRQQTSVFLNDLYEDPRSDCVTSPFAPNSVSNWGNMRAPSDVYVPNGNMEQFRQQGFPVVGNHTNTNIGYHRAMLGDIRTSTQFYPQNQEITPDSVQRAQKKAKSNPKGNSSKSSKAKLPEDLRADVRFRENAKMAFERQRMMEYSKAEFLNKNNPQMCFAPRHPIPRMMQMNGTPNFIPFPSHSFVPNQMQPRGHPIQNFPRHMMSPFARPHGNISVSDGAQIMSKNESAFRQTEMPYVDNQPRDVQNVPRSNIIEMQRIHNMNTSLPYRQLQRSHVVESSQQSKAAHLFEPKDTNSNKANLNSIQNQTIAHQIMNENSKASNVPNNVTSIYQAIPISAHHSPNTNHANVEKQFSPKQKVLERFRSEANIERQVPSRIIPAASNIAFGGMEIDPRVRQRLIDHRHFMVPTNMGVFERGPFLPQTVVSIPSTASNCSNALTHDINVTVAQSQFEAQINSVQCNKPTNPNITYQKDKRLNRTKDPMWSPKSSNEELLDLSPSRGTKLQYASTRKNQKKTIGVSNKKYNKRQLNDQNEPVDELARATHQIEMMNSISEPVIPLKVPSEAGDSIYTTGRPGSVQEHIVQMPLTLVNDSLSSTDDASSPDNSVVVAESVSDIMGKSVVNETVGQMFDENNELVTYTAIETIEDGETVTYYIMNEPTGADDLCENPVPLHAESHVMDPLQESLMLANIQESDLNPIYTNESEQYSDKSQNEIVNLGLNSNAAPCPMTAPSDRCDVTSGKCSSRSDQGDIVETNLIVNSQNKTNEVLDCSPVQNINSNENVAEKVYMATSIGNNCENNTATELTPEEKTQQDEKIDKACGSTQISDERLENQTNTKETSSEEEINDTANLSNPTNNNSTIKDTLLVDNAEMHCDGKVSNDSISADVQVRCDGEACAELVSANIEVRCDGKVGDDTFYDCIDTSENTLFRTCIEHEESSSNLEVSNICTNESDQDNFHSVPSTSSSRALDDKMPPSVKGHTPFEENILQHLQKTIDIVGQSPPQTVDLIDIAQIKRNLDILTEKIEAAPANERPLSHSRNVIWDIMQLCGSCMILSQVAVDRLKSLVGQTVNNQLGFYPDMFIDSLTILFKQSSIASSMASSISDDLFFEPIDKRENESCKNSNGENGNSDMPNILEASTHSTDDKISSIDLDSVPVLIRECSLDNKNESEAPIEVQNSDENEPQMADNSELAVVQTTNESLSSKKGNAIEITNESLHKITNYYSPDETDVPSVTESGCLELTDSSTEQEQNDIAEKQTSNYEYLQSLVTESTRINSNVVFMTDDSNSVSVKDDTQNVDLPTEQNKSSVTCNRVTINENTTDEDDSVMEEEVSADENTDNVVSFEEVSNKTVTVVTETEINHHNSVNKSLQNDNTSQKEHVSMTRKFDSNDSNDVYSSSQVINSGKIGIVLYKKRKTSTENKFESSNSLSNDSTSIYQNSFKKHVLVPETPDISICDSELSLNETSLNDGNENSVRNQNESSALANHISKDTHLHNRTVNDVIFQGNVNTETKLTQSSKRRKVRNTTCSCCSSVTNSAGKRFDSINIHRNSSKAMSQRKQTATISIPPSHTFSSRPRQNESRRQKYIKFMQRRKVKRLKNTVHHRFQHFERNMFDYRNPRTADIKTSLSCKKLKQDICEFGSKEILQGLKLPSSIVLNYEEANRFCCHVVLTRTPLDQSTAVLHNKDWSERTPTFQSKPKLCRSASDGDIVKNVDGKSDKRTESSNNITNDWKQISENYKQTAMERNKEEKNDNCEIEKESNVEDEKQSVQIHTVDKCFVEPPITETAKPSTHSSLSENEDIPLVNTVKSPKEQIETSDNKDTYSWSTDKDTNTISVERKDSYKSNNTSPVCKGNTSENNGGNKENYLLSESEKGRIHSHKTSSKSGLVLSSRTQRKLSFEEQLAIMDKAACHKSKISKSDKHDSKSRDVESKSGNDISKQHKYKHRHDRKIKHIERTLSKQNGDQTKGTKNEEHKHKRNVEQSVFERTVSLLENECIDSLVHNAYTVSKCQDQKLVKNILSSLKEKFGHNNSNGASSKQDTNGIEQTECTGTSERIKMDRTRDEECSASNQNSTADKPKSPPFSQIQGTALNDGKSKEKEIALCKTSTCNATSQADTSELEIATFTPDSGYSNSTEISISNKQNISSSSNSMTYSEKVDDIEKSKENNSVNNSLTVSCTDKRKSATLDLIKRYSTKRKFEGYAKFRKYYRSKSYIDQNGEETSYLFECDLNKNFSAQQPMNNCHQQGEESVGEVQYLKFPLGEEGKCTEVKTSDGNGNPVRVQEIPHYRSSNGTHCDKSPTENISYGEKSPIEGNRNGDRSPTEENKYGDRSPTEGIEGGERTSNGGNMNGNTSPTDENMNGDTSQTDENSNSDRLPTNENIKGDGSPTRGDTHPDPLDCQQNTLDEIPHTNPPGDSKSSDNLVFHSFPLSSSDEEDLEMGHDIHVEETDRFSPLAFCSEYGDDLLPTLVSPSKKRKTSHIRCHRMDVNTQKEVQSIIRDVLSSAPSLDSEDMSDDDDARTVTDFSYLTEKPKKTKPKKRWDRQEKIIIRSKAPQVYSPQEFLTSVGDGYRKERSKSVGTRDEMLSANHTDLEVIPQPKVRGLTCVKECFAVLDKVYNHDKSEPFRQEIKSKDVPDYYKIIKRGMCFDVIAHKLRNSIYHKLEEFTDDMKLVFTNCYQYHQKGTETYQAGIETEEFFKLKMREMFPEFPLEEKVNDPTSCQ